MKGQYIFFGINSHRPDAQLIAGTEYTDGDLASVGHQDLPDFSHKQPPYVSIAFFQIKSAYIFFIVLSADVHFNRKLSITEIKRLRRQKRP